MKRLFLGLASALILWLAWELFTWPDVEALATKNPTSTAFIRRDARKRGTKPAPLAWASYDRLSANLKRAALVSEDINFFTHDGFDRGEIKKALEEAKRDNEAPRGASTITQQLAKNLWLSPARTPIRKLKEVLLTRQLEEHLEKRRILEIYLNVVEFGPGVWGAPAAAQHYFGTSAGSLSEYQAAQLIAGLPRPSIWHPGASSRTYARRVERIQGRMGKAGFLWKQIGGRRVEAPAAQVEPPPDTSSVPDTSSAPN